ncbi:hypothetical protein B808_1124 [Fructilactobacillus florum 8D]|uniref:Uncharacterized protein n=1 Tax=Fructilactobacillus florum 8D TaxID=1221538 RepID=W9EGA5_9LACO|nr:hypothetical protein [Fructilactobacillus florum]ETO40015.1 hypothetical protein B808_1124 [Fructilactobacillus florum 8D]
MPTYNQATITNAGLKLLGSANGGTDTITYTRMVFSSMDNSKLSDDQLKAVTDVVPADLVSKPDTYQNSTTGESNVRGYVNNTGRQKGLYVKTYGVYATNKAGKEILFAIECADNPDYLIPNPDGKHPSGLMYTFKIAVNDTDNVTFTADKDVYATLDDVKKSSSDIKTDLNNLQQTVTQSNKLTDQKIVSLTSGQWQQLHLISYPSESNSAISVKIVGNILFVSGWITLNEPLNIQADQIQISDNKIKEFSRINQTIVQALNFQSVRLGGSNSSVQAVLSQDGYLYLRSWQSVSADYFIGNFSIALD